ncbi:MAG: acetate--CoA ligase family protein [Candidatus Micrarchaeota archaeon]
MNYNESAELLKKYGIKLVPSKLASSKEQALETANSFRYPVVLKLISQQFLHKSDKGLVKLNIKTKKELETAYDELIKKAGSAQIDGILVQKQARSGVELIIGGKRDPQFGPLILFGLGGIFVEIFKDISVRLCPIKREDAIEMMHEIQTYPILAGVRGKKGVNISALAALLVKVSELMSKEQISELDLNPVIAYEKGYTIVDVRMLK